MRIFITSSFIVLALLSLAAFGFAGRAKQTPPPVQSVKFTSIFSPLGTRRDAHISFLLKDSDSITVTITNGDGEQIQTLLVNHPVRAYRRIHLRWDGRTSQHKLAANGRYRVQVTLHGEGRSITVPRSITLDTVPPHPYVRMIGMRKGVAGVLPLPPGQAKIPIHFCGPVRHAPTFKVYKTDQSPPKLVGSFRGLAHRHTFQWDGKVIGVHSILKPGTYLLAISTRDSAGNEGTGPVQLPPRQNGDIRGNPGFSVRPLAVEPPLRPAQAGKPVAFFVDARGQRYHWQIRRTGFNRTIKRGNSSQAKLKVNAPTQGAGVYLLELRQGRNRATIPFAVQGQTHQRTLVVLPTITWAGLNGTDEQGAGFPTTLISSNQVTLARVNGDAGIPAGFAHSTAPLLVYFDRAKFNYDVTTDFDLVQEGSVKLSKYKGIILAGDFRWLPKKVIVDFKQYVEQGGHVASFGVDSLRRTVQVTGALLVNPSGPADTDAFGAQVGTLVHHPVEVTGFAKDQVQLFGGTDGLIKGFSTYEETLALTGKHALLAGGGTNPDHPILIAYRYGKGLVLRTGLPQWAEQIRKNSQVEMITRRMWTLVEG